MATKALRVLEWLEGVQLTSLDAKANSIDAQGFTRAISGSVQPEMKSTLPTPKPDVLLATSAEIQRDLLSHSRDEADIQNFPSADDVVQKPASASFYARSQSQPGIARMRELGLIANKDCDRLSITKVAEFAVGDQYNPRNEEPWLSAPVLCKESHHDSGSKLAPESTSKMTLESVASSVDVLQRQINESKRSSSPNSDGVESLDCRHATAPYPRETRKLSLVNDGGSVNAEKLEFAPPAESTRPEDFHVYPKEHWHTHGLSSKQERIISVDLLANDDKQAQKPDYEGVGTTDPPRVRLKFQKPQPPKRLVYENIFNLTPSETSAKTAESFRTGNGEVIELHDNKVGGTPEFHDRIFHPAAQTTHIEGTLGKGGDIQIPLFPYPHLATRCRALKCPVKGRHEKGPYLHEGKLRTRDGNIFGASNPPQEIWAAYDRIKDDDNGLGGKEKDEIAANDVKLVTRFARLHFGEATEWSIEEPKADDGVKHQDYV